MAPKPANNSGTKSPTSDWVHKSRTSSGGGTGAGSGTTAGPAGQRANKIARSQPPPPNGYHPLRLTPSGLCTLQDIILTFNAPISEEQAWAIAYQTSKTIDRICKSINQQSANSISELSNDQSVSVQSHSASSETLINLPTESSTTAQHHDHSKDPEPEPGSSATDEFESADASGIILHQDGTVHDNSLIKGEFCVACSLQPLISCHHRSQPTQTSKSIH